MRARWPIALAALVALLAGCFDGSDDVDRPEPERLPVGAGCPSAHTADQPPGEAAPVPLPLREGFETAPSVVAANGLPAGWSVTDGAWAVAGDASAPGGANVLAGAGDSDPGFSAALAGPAGSLSDFQAEVSFRMDCVQHPHGVGLVVHVADADDYQILRYSATESSWDLFTVRDGERVRRDEARQEDVDPEPGAWTTLRVVSSAGRIEAYSEGRLVLDYTLAAQDAASGQVGLFLRGSSSGAFDDLRVDDLPVSLPIAQVTTR